MTDLDADHYRKHSSFQYEAVQGILAQIPLKGNESILDIGCGDGRIAAALSKLCLQGKVLGIDPSSSMIKLANLSFPREKFPNLAFEKVTAEDFQFHFSTDIALMMNVLHWIRDPRKAFQNVFNSLNMEGCFLLLAYPRESPYCQFLETTLQENPWHSYEKKSSLNTVLFSQNYRRLLEDLGFSIDGWSLTEEISIYNTGEDLYNYVKGWLHCLIPISGTSEDAFLKRAVEHAMTQYFDKNSQTIRIPYLKLMIQAKKMG